jgi:hypothetical protein
MYVTMTKRSAGYVVPASEWNQLIDNDEYLSSITEYGTKYLFIPVFQPTADCIVGDLAAPLPIQGILGAKNLTWVYGRAITAGVTGTMDVQIRNVTDAQDMLSTKLTWDSTEPGTETAAIPAVIDTAKDDVVVNDLLAIDVDVVQTTKAKGMIIGMGFTKP